MDGHCKAQTSLEFLIVLSVALLALLIFMSISQSESVGISKAKTVAECNNAVADISAAAQDVYSQGAGAMKKVRVRLPESYEPAMSGVGNGYVRISAGGSDYVKTLDFELYGSLPQISGLHDVWVVSEGGRVRVGNAMFITDRQAISTIMAKNDHVEESLRITNVWAEDIDIAISHDWAHTSLGMALSGSSLAVGKGQSKSVALAFTSDDYAEGFYSASLNISAHDGAGSSEFFIMPITVEVEIGDDTGDGPPLTIVPGTVYFNMSRNSGAYATFQVCTNSKTSLSYVDFSPSVNAPGEWVGMAGQMTSLNAGDCYPKTLSFSVPADADFGEHSGFVYASGDAYEAADVISFAVYVGGAEDDLLAPTIESVSVFPGGPVFFGRPVAIRAIVNDFGRGDNVIAGCNVSIDSGNFSQMISKDGEFDEIEETAGYTYYSGFPLGNHVASVQCADIKGNVAEKNQSFRVVKEFLFVTQGTSPDAQEQSWLDWIAVGFSNEGYAWNVDTVSASSFMSGTPDTSFYRAIVAEKWVAGMHTRINAFTSGGGSAVMLGHAAADAPRELGLTSSSGSSDLNTNINVVDSSHYITSGYSGVVTVANSTTEFGLFWKDIGGSILANSMVSSPPHWRVLAVNNKRYFWGPVSAGALNPNGMNITGRLLDHAVNASSIE